MQREQSHGGALARLPRRIQQQLRRRGAQRLRLPRVGVEAARDRHFQGYGTARSDPSGVFRFRTILPVAYPGRTAHIHVRVASAGRNALATQLYLAGDRGNDSDFLYRQLDVSERAAITLKPEPSRNDEHALAALTRMTLRADLVLA